MAELKTIRSDMDIQASLHSLMTSADYPPLTHDRHHIAFEVQDGAVKASGYVKTPQTIAYLQNRLAMMPSVKEVDLTNLYDDESIRRESGKEIPYGVQVRVEYGTVILAGSLLEDVSVEDLVKRVALIPGVHRVITMF
jgi:osmotically-inducible protein OsmY